MIQLLLTIFIIGFAPIPWLIIAIHILVKSGRWNKRISKIALTSAALVAWGVPGYWLLQNNDFLFAQHFQHTGIHIGGIIVLLVATAIECITQRALGMSRIFGSSELKQRQDALITHSIYKYARHPRYIEHPLWALGLGLTFGYTSLLWFFIYLLIGFMLVAYFEEQELIKRYGGQYLEYKKKTPAFFIRFKN